MDKHMNRRECLRALGLSGLTAGLGLTGAPASHAQGVGESSGFQSSVIDAHKVQDMRTAATIVDGKVIQPQRELPILHQTDVLVVGGGSAGVVAAIAARRAGASVTLVERYGHFGGLWTGGLVVLIIGHIVKGGKQVCQGIGEEMMRRLDKLDGAIIDRRPGVSPTVDAEAAKYMMVEMIEEAGVDVFLHCWGVDAIVTENTVRGVVFESKSGRQAILAKIVVDATGDGDLFAAAGAEFEHRSHNVGLVSRIGNLDRIDAEKAGQAPKPRRLGSATPVPGVNWVNLTGPEVDGLDIATLTQMEMNHRKFIWNNVQRTRQTPGYEKVYLVETAPQLGVRITRILNGLNRVRLSDLREATKFPDVVGVGGSSGATHGEWQIPYGALVPTKVDNVLAAGRCISVDMGMADLVRLVPNCFVTGHAAGVAAAVAVRDNCRPRDVDIAKVQKVLRQQEAYLG
ncbi:MAG: FAD-dependent oxidoreductase [Sedimentisphaerales bacterium]|nr:FAD-dependent oxidoreductase [Sedimentisphaerales bacterium]HNY77893.1 FAD-dependent oxidoreductase [Sedimentisphaerales bacterium]HOC63289.1 FAD-dependent oxidoreductase [Sedimentisphaerales bacterium]HOH64181.1 FAD-dependent oxidoreductase [Sedimentisphaerales bacterium]HQA89993.1 FAD-dependent oxidoreductase [Sedimentisphaerales bacterium]